MNCQYCNNAFKSIQALRLHQKSARYCLKIQNNGSDDDASTSTSTEATCEYCKKNFSLQYIKTHRTKCMQSAVVLSAGEDKPVIAKLIDDISKLKTQYNDLEQKYNHLLSLLNDQSTPRSTPRSKPKSKSTPTPTPAPKPTPKSKAKPKDFKLVRNDVLGVDIFWNKESRICCQMNGKKPYAIGICLDGITITSLDEEARELCKRLKLSISENSNSNANTTHNEPTEHLNEYGETFDQFKKRLAEEKKKAEEMKAKRLVEPTQIIGFGGPKVRSTAQSAFERKEEKKEEKKEVREDLRSVPPPEDLPEVKQSVENALDELMRSRGLSLESLDNDESSSNVSAVIAAIDKKYDSLKAKIRKQYKNDRDNVEYTTKIQQLERKRKREKQSILNAN